MYWAGGTTGAPGDDAITVDGTEISGELIGGPVDFFKIAGVSYHFSAYRADITDMGLVSAGDNSFTITGFDFDTSAGTLDENNGASILVIYDDGTEADLSLVDGLDMAFFQFVPTLDATVPQTFTFSAADVDRTGDMVVMAGSVGVGRPNQIKVTTSAGDQIFDESLGSFDALLWDSLILPVHIPAGVTSVTVQLISTDSEEPLGASLGWVGAGFSIPLATSPLGSLGNVVWLDENRNGIQDDGENGVPEVAVQLLDCFGGVLAETLTDADGSYLFADLEAGSYQVRFVLPEGYNFSQAGQGTDAELDSDADQTTGLTMCTTLDAGENDLSWDAGVFFRQGENCTRTIGFWKNHAGLGPQDDLVSPLLPLWLGTPGGAESIEVTTAEQAVALLKRRDFGGSRNGIAKLYAQLLAAKLNIANGADASAVHAKICDADAFLAENDWTAWSSLCRPDRKLVLRLKTKLDRYNNGRIGPGHCDDEEEDTSCNRGGRRGGGRGGRGGGHGGGWQ